LDKGVQAQFEGPSAMSRLFALVVSIARSRIGALPPFRNLVI
jgi:hypothetical protein